MLGTGGAFHGNVVVLVMWVPFRQGPAIIESVAHCRIRTRQWTMFAALLLPTQSSELIEFWLSSLTWCQRAAVVPKCYRVPPCGYFLELFAAWFVVTNVRRTWLLRPFPP
jgi:hypothetical protein